MKFYSYTCLDCGFSGFVLVDKIQPALQAHMEHNKHVNLYIGGEIPVKIVKTYKHKVTVVSVKGRLFVGVDDNYFTSRDKLPPDLPKNKRMEIERAFDYMDDEKGGNYAT